MFNLRKKSSTPPPDFTILEVDMHSHLIAGIDDGVSSIEEALGLIRQFSKLGYKKIITTPHVNLRFRNTPEIIKNGLNELRQAVSNEGIPIEIDAAAEYLLEDGFEDFMKNGELMTFSDNRLLIELSYFIPHPAFSEIIYELQTAGYNIILAHAERYAYWHHNLSQYEQLFNRDVSLQVNLSSLSGHWGRDVRNAARQLIEQGWISYAGSDVHNQHYMEYFLRGADDKYGRQVLESGLLKNNAL